MVEKMSRRSGSLFDEGDEAETGRSRIVIGAVPAQVKLLVEDEERLVAVGNSA